MIVRAYRTEDLPAMIAICKHEKSRQTIGLAGLFYSMPV